MLAGLTAAFPGALALAALVPVLWWLHRARPHGQPLEVASVLLFRRERASQASVEPRRTNRTDRAWVRRALLVLALAGSLAGLHRLTRLPPVIVWIDGSPSMQARENGATRLQTALGQLDRELAARRVREVTLRSLARSGFALHVHVPFDAQQVAQEVPAGAPIFPEPAALDRSAEHWLVTDGANDALLRWLSTSPIDHLIQAGKLTENVAVTLLAYRPSLTGNGCGDVIVTVYDAGLGPSRRRLDLTAPPCLVAGSLVSPQPTSVPLTLQAGETRTLHFAVGPPPLRIAARLAPADALSGDDALALDVAQPLTARVAVDPACGRALESAVVADPAVVAVPPRDAQLLVDCSLQWRGSRLPRLSVHPARSLQPLTSVAGAISGSVPDGLLASGEPLTLAAGDRAVLRSNNRALAVLRPGPPRTVDTILDLQDGEAAAHDAYPLLIASLLDVTAGDVLAERVARAARTPGAGRIAPDVAALDQWQRTHRDSRPPIGTSASSDLTPAMLSLAVLLAVWELVIAARAIAAVRRYYSGAAP